MSARYLAAAVQMTSGEDKAANLAVAQSRVERATAAGAKLIVLPEVFTCIGTPETMLANAEPNPGPVTEMLSSLAKKLGVMLVGGSFCERRAAGTKGSNTSLVFGPDGKQVACYRKIHLFDVDLPGRVTVQESSWLVPGEEVVVIDTPYGRLGQAICYDVRFGELFLHLSTAGAEVICLPAAFTLATGRDHWEVMIRARAIENQAYVIAANQVGQHGYLVSTFGHSMIVDPWGTTLACATADDEFVIAEIDLERVAEIRRQLPLLANRRVLRAPGA